MLRASSVAEATARAVVAAVGKLRREPLSKTPGIAESVDWAEAATLLHRGGARWPDAFKRSIGVALKDEEDLAYVSGRLDAMLAEACRMSEMLHYRARPVYRVFVALLRANGFSVAPEQTTAFLLGDRPVGAARSDDIRRAGLATLAPPPERRAAYHALFDIHFLGTEAMDQAETEDEDVVRVQEDRRGADEPISADEVNESGQAATRAEALVERRFGGHDGEALRRLTREAPGVCRNAVVIAARAPGAAPSSICAAPCAKRSAMTARCMRLARLKRRPRPRNALLLIDVSGSMKGAHRRQPAPRPCARPRDPARRGLHLRHRLDAA